jgi:hypothetical protein
MQPAVDRWRVTLTMSVPDRHPAGSVLALRWIILRLLDALAGAPFDVKVRVARLDPDDVEDDAR